MTENIDEIITKLRELYQSHPSRGQAFLDVAQRRIY